MAFRVIIIQSTQIKLNGNKLFLKWSLKLVDMLNWLYVDAECLRNMIGTVEYCRSEEFCISLATSSSNEKSKYTDIYYQFNWKNVRLQFALKVLKTRSFLGWLLDLQLLGRILKKEQMLT